MTEHANLQSHGMTRGTGPLSAVPHDPEILLTAAKGIGEAARRMGGDPGRLLHKYRPLAVQPSSGTDAMPLRDYTQLLEEAAEMTGNEHFGLEFGENFLMTDLGPVGYLLVHARTVREGLQLFADHFQDLQEQSSITLEIDGALARIVYRIDDPRVRHRRQDAEFTLGMLNAAFRRLFGPRWQALRVDFAHASPRNFDRHAQFFDTGVEFRKKESALLFDRSLLDLPMPSPDPLLIEHLESYFARLRANRHRRPSLAEMVVRQVDRDVQNGHTPRLADIAAMHGISERARNRSLAASGTRFRRFLLFSRIQAATVLLRDTEMPLTEIAFEVGYSDPTAFSRAFRQETKLAPLVWRKRLVGVGES